jgi:hypothetical protein
MLSHWGIISLYPDHAEMQVQVRQILFQPQIGHPGQGLIDTVFGDERYSKANRDKLVNVDHLIGLMTDVRQKPGPETPGVQN